VDDRLNRHDLTDEEWQRLLPMMPADARRGRRWSDHRMVINGIMFRTRTGCPWRDLPGEYGKTAHNRYRRWSLDGTWGKILAWLRAGAMRPRGRSGRSARTRRWGARTSTPPGPSMRRPPSWSRGAPSNDKNLPVRPGREALGRSRGGLSTKIHLAADRRRRPVTRILTPGQHGDCPQFIPLLDKIRIGRRGKGRLRTRPGRAMADKAYSSAANRAYLRKRGIQAVIPVKEDQKKHRRARGRVGGRPPAFDPGHYKERNTVERCFSKLKQSRAVATRYDKRDFMYQATVDVASIRIWLRDPVPYPVP
jgi:transposase